MSILKISENLITAVETCGNEEFIFVFNGDEYSTCFDSFDQVEGFFNTLHITKQEFQVVKLGDDGEESREWEDGANHDSLSELVESAKSAHLEVEIQLIAPEDSAEFMLQF